MKKRALIVLSIIFILIFSCAYSAIAEKEGLKRVDVMFLHDTHSHLSEFATVENGESKVLGGFARIKTLINEQKEKNPDTLLLDGGDFAMGTLIQTVFEKEAAEIRMLGELGIDATTLGNHEFDYKVKGLANMLDRAIESEDILPELLVCNVDWEAMETAGLTEEQQLFEDAFDNYGAKEYTIVEKNGVKIAIIGVFGVDALKCVPNCPIAFEEPVEAVRETVDYIKKNETADMIVCISHSGTWEDESKSEDEILAKEVPELDLIVSGHTHTKLDEPIVHDDTYIVSASEYGKYLGSLSMTQKEDGRWAMEHYELIEINMDIEPDAETQEKINQFVAMVNKEYLEQFGYTKEQVLCSNEIDFVSSQDTNDFHTEMNLGSIMADAYTYAVELYDKNDTHPVDAAIVPAGTIRDTYAKGNVTTESVFSSFSLGIGADGVPGYPLVSAYLTGEELKLVAEIDASISDLMQTARLYSDGLYWHYNPHRLILNKVTDAYLCPSDGTRVEIEDDKLYRIVTDMYSYQMLGGVTDLSYGLLSIIPKDATGEPITNAEEHIITTEGKELKAWVAIAKYMESFEDTDGDGIGNVPIKYGTSEGRKVVEDSRNFADLLKNPNKFFFMITGIGAGVVVLVVVSVLLVRKGIRRRKAAKNKIR